jgi:hypothetical protein
MRPRLVACAYAAVLSGNGGYGRLDEGRRKTDQREGCGRCWRARAGCHLGWLSAGGSHRRPAPATVSPPCPLPQLQ